MLIPAPQVQKPYSGKCAVVDKGPRKTVSKTKEVFVHRNVSGRSVLGIEKEFGISHSCACAVLAPGLGHHERRRARRRQRGMTPLCFQHSGFA